MINTYVPYITNKEKQSLSSSLNSSYVSTAGPKINEFEKLFNKIFKFKYSVALNSGTSALHLALLASGVQKDDLVITPSYSFAATANAITYTGAAPWFFDCDKNFILDIKKVEEALLKTTKFQSKCLDNMS